MALSAASNEPRTRSPQEASAPRLPDFLVIGAQKSGTSDLCAALAQHPRIWFSRPKELYFFCLDDVEVLPYPFFEHFEQWEAFDWSERPELVSTTYAKHFAGARPDQLCGEGTPFYLPSRLAAERAHRTVPDAKLLVILRNPVARAYSAYWHHVKMRRSTETFENHLRYERGGTLELGHYEEQLRYWISLFGRDAIHVVLFEEYVKNRGDVAAGAFRFLGLTPPEREPAPRSNTALVPVSLRFQLALNRALRAYPAHFRTILYDEDTPPPRSVAEMIASKTIRGLGRLNLRPRRYPPMDEGTRRRLDAYYRRRNAGLSEVLGRDLRAWGWS